MDQIMHSNGGMDNGHTSPNGVMIEEQRNYKA
jgi:hypothetical protein